MAPIDDDRVDDLGPWWLVATREPPERRNDADHATTQGRTRRALAGLAVLAVMGTLLTACGFEITTTSLPDAAQGRPYVGQLEAGGGKEPYTWAITVGTLPSGLSLNATTGRITGTPTVLGTRTFTVKATGTDDKSVTQDLSIEVVVGNRWTQTDRDGGRRGLGGRRDVDHAGQRRRAPPGVDAAERHRTGGGRGWRGLRGGPPCRARPTPRSWRSTS